VSGPELDFSQAPLAAVAENLMLLRYVEYRYTLYRIFSILKMRDSAYDPSLRQYEVGGAQGLCLLSQAESDEALLAGIAQLPSEMRVKRGGDGPGGAAPP
jgi:circadian clock protein KaiC